MTGRTYTDAEFESAATRHLMSDAETLTPNEAADGKTTTELPRILDRGDPLACARRFLADQFTRDDHQMLYRHRDQFFSWIRSRWRVADDAELRAMKSCIKHSNRRAVLRSCLRQRKRTSNTALS